MAAFGGRKGAVEMYTKFGALVLAGALSLPLGSQFLGSTVDGPCSCLTAEQKQILSHMSIVYLDDGFGNQLETIRISDVNVQIVNGEGTTQTVNGLGNLIVGYNELSNPPYGDNRTGSHNIVGGFGSSYSNYGGIVIGWDNTITGQIAVALGGYGNLASGQNSVVCGGGVNVASSFSSSVAGGTWNSATGSAASILGGRSNVASGLDSTVSGGWTNTASGQWASVSGGYRNDAAGYSASVSGGSTNVANGNYTSISGGVFVTTPIISSNDWYAGNCYSCDQ